MFTTSSPPATSQHHQKNPNPSFPLLISCSFFRRHATTSRRHRHRRRLLFPQNPESPKNPKNPAPPVSPSGSLRRRADEAYRDLAAALHVDDERVVFVCRRTSLVFVGEVLVWGLVVAVAVRVLLWLGLGLLRRGRKLQAEVVVRRDRSLGGKEVVVAAKNSNDLDSRDLVREGSLKRERNLEVRREERRDKLPGWWPEMETEAVAVDGIGIEDWRRAANRLVRGQIVWGNL